MSGDGQLPMFMVDRMLGSLAKWLRILGYDSRYDNDMTDEQMLSIAKDEGRILLTRDRELAEKGEGVFLDSKDLDEQLSVVSKMFSLTYGAERRRCSVCNGRLTGIDENKARELVPAKSFEVAKEYWVCESCGKAYWNGTHWTGIMERFQRLGLIKEDSS
jgi:uncharacterized protein